MNVRYHLLVADVLLELEQELRLLGLWEGRRPPPHLLASELPFAIDTLTFPQWLQFIFIERMNLILKHGFEVPAVSGIQPMAEEYFGQAGLAGEGVIGILARLDAIQRDLVSQA